MTNRVGFHLDQQISQYTYENNAYAQRTARTSEQAGQEWTDHFTYDPDTGGITASNPDTDEREPEAYQYDKIGNRLEATKGTKAIEYKANALNQYESIQSPSPSSLATRPSFDLDGNQTQDGNRTYIWDGENRLITIQEGSSIIARYTYDHQSRRIARWIHDGTDERYLYDGWNLIAVYQKGQTQPIETYTWGKDLSGTLQGAGGVGGLLFAQVQGAKPNTWLYHYDANGNVTQVTDPRGTILEQNTYDAFGKATTTSQIPNRYRFSTKPQDSESGYNYYGYRFYDPVSGRWLSRDPIGELGGQNLYMLVNNDSINIYDLLGMVAGGGEIVSNGGSGGSDCTHTIRVAHAFSQSSGNWQHYNGSSNDGRTAYVGCAMNILNSLQSSQFSNESAGTSAVSGVSYLSQDDEALPLIPQEFLDLYQPEEIDTVDDDQMESYVDSKLVEVRDDLCSRACCRIWIEVDCPHENVHDACGQSVLYYCF